MQKNRFEPFFNTFFTFFINRLMTTTNNFMPEANFNDDNYGNLIIKVQIATDPYTPNFHH